MACLDWPEAVRRWQRVIDEFSTRITPEMYLRVSLAHPAYGDFAAARQSLELLRQVEPQLVLKGPADLSNHRRAGAERLRLARLTHRVCVQLHLIMSTCSRCTFRASTLYHDLSRSWSQCPSMRAPRPGADRFAAALPLASEVLIRPVKNSGRDVMPWRRTFRDDIIRYDIMLHVHTKASPQNYGILWNDFLLHNVCGSPAVAIGHIAIVRSG